MLAVVAVLGALGGWLTDSGVAAATGPPPDTVAATPLLSARRTPELVSRPMAARQLRDAVTPVLGAAPPGTCLTIREGAEPLVAHNETTALVPASNMKVVVGAAALGMLDPGERLVTRFATDGTPTDGSVVRGNLYMIGGGDPLLTTDTYEALFTHGVPPVTDLEAVADRVAATGITRVTGSVVGDGSRYDTARVIESWPDRYLTQGQVGPLSALIVNDGWAVDALVPGAGGGPTTDPDQHAAAVMTQLLEARDVVVDGAPVAGVAPEGATNLVEVPSATVAELVGEMLRFSDNTTAEMLVKEIGLRTRQEGSTAAGLASIGTWLTESGFDTAGFAMADGSGLSPDGRVTCQLLSSVLIDDGPNGPLATGLATPGDPGTLDDRMHPGPLADAVRAKTGTLRDVTALSGWLHTRPGHDLAFSFVINTDDRQIVASDVALQDRLLEAMLDHPQTPPLDTLSPAAPVAPS